MHIDETAYYNARTCLTVYIHFVNHVLQFALGGVLS